MCLVCLPVWCRQRLDGVRVTVSRSVIVTAVTRRQNMQSGAGALTKAGAHCLQIAPKSKFKNTDFVDSVDKIILIFVV